MIWSELLLLLSLLLLFEGSLLGVVVNFLGWDIVVSEFKLQSRYYVHFRTNTLGKGTNTIIHTQILCLIVPLLSFFGDGFGIKLPTKADMLLNKEAKPNLSI